MSGPVDRLRSRGALSLLALVALREYRRTVRRRGYLLGTLLIPLGAAAFVLLAQLFNPTDDPSQLDPTVYLVNESSLSLAADPGARVELLPDRAAGVAHLEAGRLKEVYLLPADYAATGRVQRISVGFRGTEVERLRRQAIEEQRLAGYLRRALVADRLPPGEVDRLLAPVRIEEFDADGRPISPADEFAAFLVPYAFALLFMLSIFITSGYLLQSVTEEKENRAVEIVLSSVPPLPLMTGKILGLGGAGMTQVAVWIASAMALPYWTGTRIPGLSQVSIAPPILALAVAYFVLGYAVYSGIYAAIGALAPGTREAQQYAGFLVMPAVLPLIATAAFLSDTHQPLVIGLALFPFTAPAAMLQILALEESIPWPLVAASLGGLALTTVLTATLSARVFRATVLLYGKRPGPGEIARVMLGRA